MSHRFCLFCAIGCWILLGVSLEAAAVPPGPIATRPAPAPNRNAPPKRTEPKKAESQTKSAPYKLQPGKKPPPGQRKTMNDEPLPWRLDTQVPMFLVGGGGLILTSIGLIGSLAEPEQTPVPAGQVVPPPAPSPWGILFFGGLSVMSSSVSAALWRSRPKPWMAILGSVIAGGVAVSGVLLTAMGNDTLTLSMGWGFLASLPVHIGLNVVGWINVKHYQKVKEIEQQAYNPLPKPSPVAKTPPLTSSTHTFGRFE